MFDFSGFELLQDGDLAQDRPLVVFAPSGMLTGGASLDIFPDIASDSKNLILIPGYCIRGTLGHEVQEGAKEVQVKNRRVSIRCRVSRVPFTAHTDGQGIVSTTLSSLKDVVSAYIVRKSQESRARSRQEVPNVLDLIETE